MTDTHIYNFESVDLKMHGLVLDFSPIIHLVFQLFACCFFYKCKLIYNVSRFLGRSQPQFTVSVIYLSVCLSQSTFVSVLKELFSHLKDTYSWKQLFDYSLYFFSIWIHYSFFMCLMNYKEINCSNNCYRNLIKDIY